MCNQVALEVDMFLLGLANNELNLLIYFILFIKSVPCEKSINNGLWFLIL